MLLKIEHLKKSFNLSTPLRDVSCEVNEGDVIAIIGPSGCGKSTFINCINRLVEPTAGRIFFCGEEITAKTDLPAMRMRIGMVFQAFHLFSHLTVLENIMLAPLKLRKKSRREAYEKAMSLLKMVGLSGKADRYPDELSGGQQQRIAICRSLAMEPEILLLDEPTSALDPTMVGEVETVIRRLAQEGMTMLIVTHEMKFARSIANRVFYMDEGGIYEEGSPEQIFEDPQRDKTRWFISRMKVFSEEIPLADFDLLGTQNRIATFARSQMMPSRLVLRLQLVVEEYFCGILARLEPEQAVQFRMAYNEQEEKVELTFSLAAADQSLLEPAGLDRISGDLISELILPGSLNISDRDGNITVTMCVGGGAV